MQGDKPLKLKKLITPKRLDNILKHQEHMEIDKAYNPGQVTFDNTEQCQSRVVNFFGDIHTEVFSLKININDDKSVAVGCSNGEAKIYDIYQGKVLTIGYTSRMAGYPCTAVKWKPLSKSDYVACNCDGTIKWYSQTHESAYGHYQNNEKSYLCGDYQSKEEWCVFGTDLYTLELFDNQTMKPMHEYQSGSPEELTTNHHTNRVFSVRCLPNDKNVFFSGGWDSTVHVWDVRVGSGSIRKFPGPSVSADSLDYKKGVLLAGNYQNNDIVQLYDFDSGKLIQTLDIKVPHNSNAYCFTAAFAQRSEHDLIAVGLTGCNSVKVLLDKKVVSTIKFQAAPLSLDFYRIHNKDYLVVGGLQGTIYAIRMKVRK